MSTITKCTGTDLPKPLLTTVYLGEHDGIRFSFKTSELHLEFVFDYSFVILFASSAEFNGLSFSLSCSSFNGPLFEFFVVLGYIIQESTVAAMCNLLISNISSTVMDTRDNGYTR